MYLIADFFAGIGGGSKGFLETSNEFKVVYANDNNEKCKLSYDINHEAKITL